MQYYELTRILLPPPEYFPWKDLFVRNHTRHLLLDNQYVEVNVHEFNTWMNLFAASKYYKYCDLGELYLKLNIKGGYHLQIIGSNRNHAFGRFDTILVDRYIEEEYIEVHIPGAKQYEGVYFTFIENKNKPVEFRSVSWVTDKAPVRNTRLAIVACTFKRETYITKTIATFEDFIERNDFLKDRIKLFVVDNGKTLDVSRSNKTTQIYHNINAGGAGGFTRGLMEVCSLNDDSEKGSPYTRVLFMDDDVDVLPESIFRTLAIADFLKEEYKDAFINGSMMNTRFKDLCFETLAILNYFFSRGYKPCNLSMYDYHHILDINDIPNFVFEKEKCYSAWWYQCFHLDIIKKSGLPLPLFFQGDDIEWGMRNQGKHHISMNGICVWHDPFEWRVSSVAWDYYRFRNQFFLNMMYLSNFKNKIEKYFKDRFYYNLETYNYTTVEIVLRAMDDILKGSAVFYENPELQFQEVKNIGKQIQYFDADEPDIERAKHYFPKAGKKRRIIYKLTHLGKYCPSCILRKNSVALEWYPPIDNFSLQKEVRVFNLLTKKFCVRKFDRKAMFHYEKQFYLKLEKIKASYDLIRDDIINSHKVFTTVKFWKKYLSI